MAVLGIYGWQLQDSTIGKCNQEGIEMDGNCFEDPSAPVHVLVLDGPATLCPTSTADALERKRQMIWHNSPRNQLVGKVAGAFSNHRIEGLWDAGLLLDQEKLPSPPPWPLWVAVLVESVEHARNISELLPDWRLIHAIPGSSAGLPLNPRSGPENNCRTLITLVAANQMPRFDPDVLIVPVGGDWAFDLPNFFRSTGQPLILVDVADDFDDVASEGTRCRLRTYVGRGWSLVGGRKWMPLFGQSRPISSRNTLVDPDFENDSRTTTDDL